jgi:hypothetical protein
MARLLPLFVPAGLPNESFGILSLSRNQKPPELFEE